MVAWCENGYLKTEGEKFVYKTVVQKLSRVECIKVLQHKIYQMHQRYFEIQEIEYQEVLNCQ